MSDSVMKEILDTPRDFLRYVPERFCPSHMAKLTMFGRDGQNFLNRCTKPDRREFLKISQAVGVGVVVMGAIGYIVKLSTSLLGIAFWQSSEGRGIDAC